MAMLPGCERLDFWVNQRRVGSSLWEFDGRTGPSTTRKGVLVTLTPTSSSSAQRELWAAGAEPLSIDRASQQVQRMVRQGMPFDRVEDAIDAAPFAPLHKSSLWLLAWSLREPAVQRRDALQMAGAFAPHDHPGHRAWVRPGLRPRPQA